jgi:3'(2'), 5'-bisphosphate nucleotidase
MFDNELAIALKATQQATAICQRVQATISKEASSLEKQDKSPVTVADFASQAIIAAALMREFPDVPLIGEEDSSALREPANEALLQRVLNEVRTELGDQSLDEDTLCKWIDHGGSSEGGELFWTLDPIDGTKGFLRGEQYAIALALVKQGEPVCATLGCPNLPHPDGSIGGTFTANAGRAQCVGQSTTDIQVSSQEDPSLSRFCESVESAHSDHSQSKAIAERLGIAGESVRMDSQAKYASVARGDAEIYLRLPTRKGYVERIWDHAAGYAILRAAGGRITDIEGKDLEFHHGRGLDANRGVVASNGPLHEQLIEAIAAT